MDSNNPNLKPPTTQELKRIKIEVKEEPMETENPLETNTEIIIKTEQCDPDLKCEEIEIKYEPVEQLDKACSSKQDFAQIFFQEIMKNSKECQTDSLITKLKDSETESDMSEDDEFPDEESKQLYMDRFEKFKKFESYMLSRDADAPDSDEDADKTKAGMIYQFKITLIGGIEPRIWRRIQVPGDFTFRQFHVAIQRAMGWESADYDYHLHEFCLEHPRHGFDIKMGEKFDDIRDENVYKIYQYITKEVNKVFTYEYDLGFGWTHEVCLEEILVKKDEEKYPKCIDGKRACPPEDVGSLGGSYENFCEAINNKNHPDHEEFVIWLERDHFNPEEFNPENIFNEPEEIIIKEEPEPDATAKSDSTSQ